MGQVKEDITSTPSLLSLYILQKVAKVGIYPPSSIFIYAFMGEQYAWSYGPDGSSYDPGPAGIKILLEVHHRQADSTSPYMGRLKNHLLKVFPLGAEGREFLGVLILKSDQYDNLLLDRRLIYCGG